LFSSTSPDLPKGEECLNGLLATSGYSGFISSTLIIIVIYFLLYSLNPVNALLPFGEVGRGFPFGEVGRGFPFGEVGRGLTWLFP
jgi:hypothetical protein